VLSYQQFVHLVQSATPHYLDQMFNFVVPKQKVLVETMVSIYFLVISTYIFENGKNVIYVAYVKLVSPIRIGHEVTLKI
jgi:hypothetical protein